jgi:hypothetical protein
MNEILLAILRKAIFIALIVITYWGVDRFLFDGFDTVKELKGDPKAIALLLGLLAVAAALA